MPQFNLAMFLAGCIGGLIPDVLRLIKGRYGKLAAYSRYLSFWLGLFFLVIVGGLTAWVLHASDITQALAYGFGGPEILSKFLSGRGPSGVDRGALDRGERKFDLREWWKS
jgi:hypothetical protein